MLKSKIIVAVTGISLASFSISASADGVGSQSILKALARSKVLKASGIEVAKPTDPEFQKVLERLKEMERRDRRSMSLFAATGLGAVVLGLGSGFGWTQETLQDQLPRLKGYVHGNVSAFVKLPQDFQHSRLYSNLFCETRYFLNSRRLLVYGCKVNKNFDYRLNGEVKVEWPTETVWGHLGYDFPPYRTNCIQPNYLEMREFCFLEFQVPGGSSEPAMTSTIVDTQLP